MKIQFKDIQSKDFGKGAEDVAVALFDGGRAIDPIFSPLTERRILHFEAKFGIVQTVADICDFAKVHMIVVSLEDNAKLRQVGGYIFNATHRDLVVHVFVGSLKETDIAQIAYGLYLASYTFTKYKTIDNKPNNLETIVFVGDNTSRVENYFKELQAVAEGVFLARDLVNEPANVLTPEKFAKTISSLGVWGIKVTLLGKTELQRLGMNALLGVAQGSINTPYVAVMEYVSTEGERPYVFVGKGVTFDAGGISLKPARGMEDMKADMGGAAAVVGALKAVARRKAKANVVGIVGLVENMPGGGAQRPGDIVTSMSGQTIEVINTDAEGRLVLADCLTYAQTNYKPKIIVNLATLTGAIVVALGKEYAGLFSNSDALARKLYHIGRREGEWVWHMPLGEGYDRMLESKIADMRNIGGDGPEAGACTAAQFLKRFIRKDTVWAHLDIAAKALDNKGKPTCAKGATGYGVNLLNSLVLDGEPA